MKPLSAGLNCVYRVTDRCVSTCSRVTAHMSIGAFEGSAPFIAPMHPVHVCSCLAMSLEPYRLHSCLCLMHLCSCLFISRALEIQRKKLLCMQKGGRQKSDSNQRPAQVLQGQSSVGGPSGPGTPRVPPPSNQKNRGAIGKDGSFDLGSFLAN